MGLNNWFERYNAIFNNLPGIRKVFAAPVMSINDADLPAVMPVFPTVNEQWVSFVGEQWPTYTLTYWIIVQAVQQSLPADKFNRIAELIDQLVPVINWQGHSGSVSNWQIGIQQMAIADGLYWVITVKITCHGG